MSSGRIHDRTDWPERTQALGRGRACALVAALDLVATLVLLGALGVVAALAFVAAPAHAGEALPDPTRPPADALPAAPASDAAKPSRLELRAIIHSDDRRLAVLDGRRVAVGDRVGDATVLSIEPDRVRLRRDGEIVEIELVSPAFKNARRASSPPPGEADTAPERMRRSDPSSAPLREEKR